MSNLTDFFPGAGGAGGGLSVDPLDMRRHLYGAALLHTKWGTTYNAATVNNNNQGFWDVYDFNGGSYATPVIDQYVNLIDITSSTNGGYLLNVIGPNINSTEYCNFKITVDGKETIIPVDRTTGVNTFTSDIKPVLGNIVPGLPNVTASNDSSFLFGQQNMAYDFYRSGAYQVSVNGFITSQYQYAYGSLSARAMENYQMGIKFNETLKVDIQTNGNATTNLYDKIGAQYQLR